jgi:hypothetical protein
MYDPAINRPQPAEVSCRPDLSVGLAANEHLITVGDGANDGRSEVE